MFGRRIATQRCGACLYGVNWTQAERRTGKNEMSMLTAIALVGAGGFAGLELGVDGGEVAAALARECVRAETVAVAPPRTPLAAQTEVHMRCFGVLGERRETDADFLIADGRLRLVELRGPGVTEWAAATAAGEGVALADYTVYRDDGIVLNDARGQAWLIAADDIRSYAFLQQDPFETPFEQTEPAPPVLPSELEIGAGFDETAARFARTCRSHTIRELDPASHPLGPGTHVQIDCYGYPFLGFPRLIEAVFADGALTHVWILTTAQEEARHRAALVAHYGEAIRSDGAFEVYGDGTVALRKDDQPEVLFMSGSMAEHIGASMPGEGR
jgi:hypothetical protein